MPPLPSALLLCLLLYAAALGVSEVSPASASASASGDLHLVCPTPCVCDVIGRQIQVDCSYSSLSHVPPALPSNLTQLYLSGNPLERLSRDDLQNSHLRHLEDFQCTDCHLTELQADLFQGLQNLKYIDISNNDIQDLPTDVFDGLPLLRFVNVQSNQRLDCMKMVTAFRETFPRVEIMCVDIEAASSASSVLSRRRRDDSNQSFVTVEDASSAATDASGAAKDPPIPVIDAPGQSTEPDSGFGVGTIIFITILSVIIFIVCFKFVFLRLKRRFWRGDRHSEEQPLDSD